MEEEKKVNLDNLKLKTSGMRRNLNEEYFARQHPHISVYPSKFRFNISVSLIEILKVAHNDWINIVQSSVNRFVYFIYKTENKEIGKKVYIYQRPKCRLVSNMETTRSFAEVFRMNVEGKYKSIRLYIDYKRPLISNILGEEVTAYAIYDIPARRLDMSEEERIEYENDMKEAFEDMKEYLKQFNKKDKLINI